MGKIPGQQFVVESPGAGRPAADFGAHAAIDATSLSLAVRQHHEYNAEFENDGHRKDLHQSRCDDRLSFWWFILQAASTTWLN
jgi:hypothetical protein